MPEAFSISPNGRSPTAQKFRKVAEIARLIHESGDLNDTLRRLTEGVCMHSSWSTSTIQALDLERQITMPIVRYDPYRPDHGHAAMREWEASGSPLGRIVETGQLMVIPDVQEQSDYPNFRDDAQRRGYRTAVLIPLKFPDIQGRAIVFSVYSFDRVEVDDAERGFLQCLADLADLAVRRVQMSAREAQAAQDLRDIISNLTEALATTLDMDHSRNVFEILSKLFKSGWFAVDLMSGRAMSDEAMTMPILDVVRSRLPDSIIRHTLRTDAGGGGQEVRLSLDDKTLQTAHVRGLDIDGRRVGALFLLGMDEMSPQDEIAVQAGQFALSTLMLRNHVAFRIRGYSAQRLMKRLFAGDLSNPVELREEAAILDFSLDRTMRLLAIRYPARQWLDDGAGSFLIRKMQQTFGQVVAAVFDETLYLLLYDREENTSEKLRDYFLSRIRPVISEKARATLSDHIVDLKQVASAFEICQRNLEIAESMGASGWISGGDVDAFTMLMASVSETVANDFLARAIEPIADGGSHKGQVALETLEAYLASGRRLQDSAERLRIHVSTMRYRLERLSERYGLELNSPQQCFELELALRLFRLRSSYKT